MKPQTRNPLVELMRQGHRITKVRAKIVELLSKYERPLAAAEISAELKKVGLRPNKTTIYRELAYLVEAGLVSTVDLGDGKLRYESAASGHHHHLVCLNCNRIEELEMDAHLTHQERQISQNHEFRVLRHSLEFFGICRNCQ